MPSTKTVLSCLGSLVLIIALNACTMESSPVKGFVLPDGDIALGEQVFTKYGCNGCHTIPGVDLPVPTPEPAFMMEIGGEVYRVKNEGELLTAVINPTHVISEKYASEIGANGETPMPYYGDVMTITEMINLVAFLRVQYSKMMPDFFESYVPDDMKEQ